MTRPPVLHATAIARWGAAGWRAVLLRGPSGSGKSDLALRALSAGWRLVADDRAVAWASQARLYVRAPARLSGLVEARGLGVLAAAPLDIAAVGLVVDLVASPDALERVPAVAWVEIEGVRLRQISLFGREASAPAKLALALEAATLGAEPEASYQAGSADVAEAPGAAPGASQEE